MSNINWMSCSFKPSNGEIVAVKITHWKKQKHLSDVIYFGEVEYSSAGEWRVTNLDWIGTGASSWYPNTDDEPNYELAYFDVWAYAKDFN